MIHNINSYIFPAAFGLLPGSMDTPASRAMLLAIGLQESRFEHRRQMGGGPAQGFWQFEKAGVQGVIEHPSTRAFAIQVCQELIYTPSVIVVATSIANNDVLACAFARLLLWTVDGMLPSRGFPERGWRQYIDGWRPGKPHRLTWNDNFALAWTIVEP